MIEGPVNGRVEYKAETSDLYTAPVAPSRWEKENLKYGRCNQAA